jgi:hypothetical protein
VILNEDKLTLKIDAPNTIKMMSVPSIDPCRKTDKRKGLRKDIFWSGNFANNPFGIVAPGPNMSIAVSFSNLLIFSTLSSPPKHLLSPTPSFLQFQLLLQGNQAWIATD